MGKLHQDSFSQGQTLQDSVEEAPPFPNHILGMDGEEEYNIIRTEESEKTKRKKAKEVKKLKEPSGPALIMSQGISPKTLKKKGKKEVILKKTNDEVKDDEDLDELIK